MPVIESAKEIWEAVLEELQLQLTRANYETWLKDTVGLSYDRNKFVVGVPTRFASVWLERRLGSLIRKTLTRVIGNGVEGDNLTVCFQVQEQTAPVWSEVCPKCGEEIEMPPFDKTRPLYEFFEKVYRALVRHVWQKHREDFPSHIKNPKQAMG